MAAATSWSIWRVSGSSGPVTVRAWGEDVEDADLAASGGARAQLLEVAQPGVLNAVGKRPSKLGPRFQEQADSLADLDGAGPVAMLPVYLVSGLAQLVVVLLIYRLMLCNRELIVAAFEGNQTAAV